MSDKAPNRDQAEYWSSAEGAKWVDHQAFFDGSMAPVLERLLAAADLRAGQHVLDIGCGTGASTLAAAAMVGPEGKVTGLDISPLMLARARERAAQAGIDNVAFIEGDAQTHAFSPASIDALISRFGVMFFSDPVAAFANMARALKPRARLTFIAWGPMAENPWFALPLAAAAARLGAPEPPPPHAPGPMAFSDQAHVSDILARAGLSEITVQEVRLAFTPPGDVASLADFLTHVGPAARIIAAKQGSAADARAITADIRAALAPFAGADGVRVPALLNLFSARRPQP